MDSKGHMSKLAEQNFNHHMVISSAKHLTDIILLQGKLANMPNRSIYIK